MTHTVINTLFTLLFVLLLNLGYSQPNPNGIFSLYIVLKHVKSNCRREDPRGLSV